MVHAQRTSDEKRPGRGRQRINPREFATTGPITPETAANYLLHGGLRQDGGGDQRGVSINPRGKKTCVNRNFAACQTRPPDPFKKSGPLEAVSSESAGKKESFPVQVDRIAANFPSRAHFVDPHGEAGDIEHGEGVGGLDTGHSQERAGVDDRAAGAPVDHGDVCVAEYENSCVALVPELLDRRRQWLVGRDILGVASGRAVVQLDDPALAFKPAAGRQAAQEVPGVVTQVSRFPAPQSQHLPPLDDPAVVVAADAGNPSSAQLGHDGIRLATVADQIAQANDLIDGKLLEPGERRLERADVTMDVSDESKPHGIESVQGLMVNYT